MTFATVQDVKDFISACDPEFISIHPHHSASYIWEVRCPSILGRCSYGFSTSQSLINWANEHLAPAAAAS